ncbi:hypothetical protein DID88_008943 [Monilinia fructigena]|uniref:Uncharacterized protein n=1 Tax=Monilinia fructigena TaxID=38457 RepID=A0A395J7D0_9HELO|nr:hypothetical protein DID88_008943 [Monilinia fructigena]
MQYADVRKALKSFEGTHIPTEFAKREAVARKEVSRTTCRRTKETWKERWCRISRKRIGYQAWWNAGKDVTGYRERKRTKELRSIDKEIRENGEKWLKEEAAMEEKAKEEGLKAMKSGMTGGWFGGWTALNLTSASVAELDCGISVTRYTRDDGTQYGIEDHDLNVMMHFSAAPKPDLYLYVL